MSGKPKYVFVDVLDFYPFDTRRAGGINLVMKINGKTCTFTDEIHSNDIVDLYWE